MKLYALSFYCSDSNMHEVDLEEVYTSERAARVRRIELIKKEKEVWKDHPRHYLPEWCCWKTTSYSYDYPYFNRPEEPVFQGWTDMGIEIEEFEVNE